MTPLALIPSTAVKTRGFCDVFRLRRDSGAPPLNCGECGQRWRRSNVPPINRRAVILVQTRNVPVPTYDCNTGRRAHRDYIAETLHRTGNSGHPGLLGHVTPPN